jgi:hypothetical protein
MQLFISRQGVQEGPFSVDQIRSWMQAGQLPPNTPAWREGLADWQPVGQILGLPAPGPSPGPQPGNPYQVGQNPVGMGQVAHPFPPQTSSGAVWSLVLGIFSLLSLLFFILAPLFFLPAIICGHVSRKSIRLSQGRLTGDGMAITGLILGYLSVLIFCWIHGCSRHEAGKGAAG